VNQEKKDKVGWIACLVGGIGLGTANLIFIFYCMASFFDAKFGYGAAVPAILLYIFANVAIIFILTEVINWVTE
jgi:hypothetical protein